MELSCQYYQVIDLCWNTITNAVLNTNWVLNTLRLYFNGMFFKCLFASTEKDDT